MGKTIRTADFAQLQGTVQIGPSLKLQKGAMTWMNVSKNNVLPMTTNLSHDQHPSFTSQTKYTCCYQQWIDTNGTNPKTSKLTNSKFKRNTHTHVHICSPCTQTHSHTCTKFGACTHIHRHSDMHTHVHIYTMHTYCTQTHTYMHTHGVL